MAGLPPFKLPWFKAAQAADPPPSEANPFATEQYVADHAGGDSGLPTFTSPADDGKSIGWLTGAWQKVTYAAQQYVDDAVDALYTAIAGVWEDTRLVHIDGSEQINGEKILTALGIQMFEYTPVNGTETADATYSGWSITNDSGITRTWKLPARGLGALTVVKNSTASLGQLLVTGTGLGDAQMNPSTVTLQPGQTAIFWGDNAASGQYFHHLIALYVGDVQPLDSDLSAIAALAPSNDSFLQRKSFTWTFRTPAQVIADLMATAGWVFSAAVGFASGSATNPSVWFRASSGANSAGAYSPNNGQGALAAAGNQIIVWTSTTFQIIASRILQVVVNATLRNDGLDIRTPVYAAGSNVGNNLTISSGSGASTYLVEADDGDCTVTLPLTNGRRYTISNHVVGGNLLLSSGHNIFPGQTITLYYSTILGTWIVVALV